MGCALAFLAGFVLLGPRPAAAGWRTFVDGAPTDGAVRIFEDSKGDLWFGTWGEGLYRFDGIFWERFDTSDGLPSDFLVDIVEDREGNIWIGTTRDGVARFDGSTWRTFGVDDGFHSNEILDLHVDREGKLWVVTSGGVIVLRRQYWDDVLTARISPVIFLPSNPPYLIEDRRGTIWIRARHGGVWRFDGTRGAHQFVSAEWYTNGFVEDARGQVWVSTSGQGLFRFDGASWRGYGPSSGLPFTYVSDLAADSLGYVWIGSSEGAARFDGVEWTVLTVEDGLPGNGVDRIEVDRPGNVWIWTGEGVRLFDGKHLTPLDSVLNDSPRGRLTILNDRWGNLWFGTKPILAFDYSGTVTYSTDDGLAGNPMFWHYSALEDSAGNIWFGTDAGAARFDGAHWSMLTTADGLIGKRVIGIGEDRDGNLWFGGDGGVSRFDGSSWTRYSMQDGLADTLTWQVLEDRTGNLWFPTLLGVSRFDGSSWETFFPIEQPSDDYVVTLDEDTQARLWFRNYGWLRRFDGSDWTIFTPEADGIPTAAVVYCARSGDVWVGGESIARYSGDAWDLDVYPGEIRGDVDVILEDPAGNVWFGFGELGQIPKDLLRYDGTRWTTFTSNDGIFGDGFGLMLIERSGALWFSDRRRVQRHEPDSIPPRTAFLSRPPGEIASSELTAAYVAAYGESNRIEYSHRLNGGAWSPWSPVGSWTGSGLSDGDYVLEARSRDVMGNVDPFPAVARFTVDATPPQPLVTSPAFGDPVRGPAEVRGTAADPRFASYRVEVRPSGTATWDDASVLAQSASPVQDGTLALWNTDAFPDGVYDLRLSVTDSLGLVGSVITTVVVDNEAPFIDETAPVTVRAALGGDVYTTGAETHLYFPPNAFAQDALVTVEALDETNVPETLVSGATRLLPGYAVAWSGELRKPARLTVSLAGVAEPAGVAGAEWAPAVYREKEGTWDRLGGTLDEAANSMTLAVTEAGRYAVYADDGAGTGDAVLTQLTLTPRVFAPRGGYADREVGIGFSLGRPGPVTVRVYSRSGRLIREVMQGEVLGAGANQVLWDGRDRDGGVVPEDLYLVTVEALGTIHTKTLAVVR